MHNHPYQPIHQLPLSWTSVASAEPAFRPVDLPFSSQVWIPTADVPHEFSFERLHKYHLSNLHGGFILQNCNPMLRDYLIGQGCAAVPMGAEAVLDLPWRGKKSVRELARRGRRHGCVHEISWSKNHQRKLAALKQAARPRQGVQLKHIERSQFDAGSRGFVFASERRGWLAAVTLSRPGAGKYHVELLLRHRSAPAGTMEALISAVAEVLGQEGASTLSLGPVLPLPESESEAIFRPHRHPKEKWILGQAAFRLGRAFNFAFNAEGLWRFKNKFEPRWEPLYLCGYPDVSLMAVFGMLKAAGYWDLVWEKTATLPLILNFIESLPNPRNRLPSRAFNTRRAGCIFRSNRLSAANVSAYSQPPRI